MDVLRVAQEDFREKLAALKDGHQAFDHARIGNKLLQNGLVAFEQALQIDQRPLRVGSGSEGGLKVRLDGGEGFSEEGGDRCQRVIHDEIIPVASLISGISLKRTNIFRLVIPIKKSVTT